jgi:hypothetical protein
MRNKIEKRNHKTLGENLDTRFSQLVSRNFKYQPEPRDEQRLILCGLLYYVCMQ